MTVELHNPVLSLRWGNVSKVAAEGVHGSFVLLPRHIDIVVALLPGLLHIVADGCERWLAVHEGVLVKCGDDISIASMGVVENDDLDLLAAEVRRMETSSDEKERNARAALAGLEASLVRGLAGLERHV